MGLTIFFAKLCYLYIPLHKVMQKMMGSKKYMCLIIVSLVGMYVLSNSIFFEPLDSPIVDIFLISGLSFILAYIGDLLIKIILELNEKRKALRIYSEFDNLPIAQAISSNDYEKHLQVIHVLSLISTDDFEKIMRYTNDNLNNFEDDEVGFDSKTRACLET